MKANHQQKLEDDLEIITAKSVEEIENIRSIWEEMQRNAPSPVPNADINRYLAVVDSMNEAIQPHIMLLSYDGKPETMVIGRIERRQITCRVGYSTILKPSLRCLSIVYGGILGRLSNEVCVTLVQELVKTLKRGEADVILFSQLRIDSPIYKAVLTTPNSLCRDYFPKLQVHWRMSVPENIDTFYRRLSPHHKKNLRRLIRRLEKAHPYRVKMVTYSKESELDDAVSAMAQISSKTYQSGLSQGFVDNERTRNMLKAAAKQGWLRVNVLFIENEPAAFESVLQYGRTRFGEIKGFDPKWKKFRVGTTLFLKGLEQICNNSNVDFFDFGFGDAEDKQHYGDQKWTEASVYIFAPRLYPVFINILESSMTGLSLGLQHILNKIGLKGWMRRRWRNLLEPGTQEETT